VGGQREEGHGGGWAVREVGCAEVPVGGHLCVSACRRACVPA